MELKINGLRENNVIDSDEASFFFFFFTFTKWNKLHLVDISIVIKNNYIFHC